MERIWPFTTWMLPIGGHAPMVDVYGTMAWTITSKLMSMIGLEISLWANGFGPILQPFRTTHPYSQYPIMRVPTPPSSMQFSVVSGDFTTTKPMHLVMLKPSNGCTLSPCSTVVLHDNILMESTFEQHRSQRVQSTILTCTNSASIEQVQRTSKGWSTKF